MALTILALETSTEACSVALARDGEVIERHEIAGRGHTERVFPMIDAVLGEASAPRTAIDVVAFGRGPGSFTGVRIAASIAQGIAFAGDLPVVPVSTLAALAVGGARVSGALRFACALDARRAEIYAAAYVFDDAAAEPIEVVAECVIAPGKLVLPAPHDWVGVGNGWQTYAGRFGATGAPPREVPLPHPRARDVATLAAAMHAAGRSIAAHEAVPLYLRRGVD